MNKKHRIWNYLHNLKINLFFRSFTMQNFISYLVGCIGAFAIITNTLGATTIDPEKNESTTQVPFTPFAGKITKNKVRMRLAPALESAILRELNKDDLLVVVAEDEDFYAVQPPLELKAYVYRTFVLDNVIEGNHVNVRLEPNLEAPVIIQLNSGDKVEGEISPLNSKWLEIATPITTKFYVSKDFIEKIGEPYLVQALTKKRESVNRLLESTHEISELELNKPFNQMQMDGIFQSLNNVISDKTNNLEQIDKAKSLLNAIQDKYLQKKIAFLEEKPQTVIITKFQNEDELQETVPTNEITPKSIRNQITAKMSSWLSFEDNIYELWSSNNSGKSKEQFYEKEKQNALVLSGRLEAYDRSVKNKPGDYILVNNSNHLPVAYLYSTKINLQNILGEEVTLKVSERPNNNFAFPAYFVLDIQ